MLKFNNNIIKLYNRMVFQFFFTRINMLLYCWSPAPVASVAAVASVQAVASVAAVRSKGSSRSKRMQQPYLHIFGMKYHKTVFFLTKSKNSTTIPKILQDEIEITDPVTH